MHELQSCRRIAWPLAAALLLAAGLAACSRDGVDLPVPPPGRTATSARVADKVAGYLAPAERPDSIALLPPPPASGSTVMATDQATYDKLLPLKRTPRWALAGADGNLQFPAAADTFACALGIDMNPQRLPRLYVLLERTVVDAGQSTAAAKRKYQRQRPFEITGDEICVPSDAQALRGNASYPSGHAAIGRVWGEVLAAVAPERSAAVRERGRQFGLSRAVCRLHWMSDIDAGRTVGMAVISALGENPAYVADLEAARAEVALAVAAGSHPSTQACANEAATFALTGLP
jgi:acid phosphatase (class A)